MNNKLKSSDLVADLQTAAVCGLFCPSCGVYQATIEDDQARLQQIAEKLNQPVDETRCTGCRSAVVSLHCRDCRFVACASQKDIAFCGSCTEFPCDDLKAFQRKAPHRAELWQNQAHIRSAGWENWFQEMKQHYACETCQTINSAYDLKCRSCEQVPPNNFVKTNS